MTDENTEETNIENKELAQDFCPYNDNTCEYNPNNPDCYYKTINLSKNFYLPIHTLKLLIYLTKNNNNSAYLKDFIKQDEIKTFITFIASKNLEEYFILRDIKTKTIDNDLVDPYTNELIETISYESIPEKFPFQRLGKLY